jgi:hypothetical protein
MGLAATLAGLVVLTLGPMGTSAAPSAAPTENAVVHWSRIADAAISAGPRPPASSTVLGAIVYGAMYDAVAAVEGGLEPFATGVTAPPGASVDAAVAQAARDTLVARVKGQPAAVQVVEAAYADYMGFIADGPAKDGGRAVGAAAAAGMLAMRTGDHFDDVVAYVQPPKGPGVFEPIAPTTPVDVKLGLVRPFTYATASQYEPDGPLELTSKRYARDVAEVQAYGRATSTLRSTTETETVRFFTESPFIQYGRALRDLALARGLDLGESARLLAYTNVAAADTQIACWWAKYHFYFWRPTHAIQKADTDDNPATSPDLTWSPLIVGNHPEYPSGHGCVTTAVTEALRNYFGTKDLRLVISSTAVGAGLPRTYENLNDLAADVEDARVWGGLHFRTTMTQTAKQFRQVARDVGKQHFRADDHDQDEADDD